MASGMDTAPRATGFEYEPYEDDSRRDQFEIYKKMRAQAPVYVTESGWWCISRYDDVAAVLMSPDRFSSEIIQTEAFGLPTSIDPDMDPEALQMMLAIVTGMPVPLEELLSGRVIVSADPPEHTRQRRIVNRGFTARRMEALRPKIEQIVDELLAGIENETTFELVSRLAAPLPIRVIADFLSADPEDYDRIVHWADEAMECSSGAIRGTPEAQGRLLQMLREFGEYFVPRIEARRAVPHDDLIGDLVRATEAETLTSTEALLFLLAIMVAGTESTTGLLGSTVVCLLENPDQLDQVRADPTLCRAAVQETLRYRAPFQFFWRVAVVDTEIAGVTIPAGAKVLVIPGSANMDPERFPDPDSFDVRRVTTSPLLTFGKGIHHCLGAHLATLEAEIALRALLPHLDRFALPDDVELEFPPSYITYGYQRIPLVARPT